MGCQGLQLEGRKVQPCPPETDWQSLSSRSRLSGGPGWAGVSGVTDGQLELRFGTQTDLFPSPQLPRLLKQILLLISLGYPEDQAA